MTVSEAFLIFVDDILSLYLLASPYSCTGIKQLLQICIYMLSAKPFPGGYPEIELLKLLGGIIENRETHDFQWSTASKFVLWTVVQSALTFFHTDMILCKLIHWRIPSSVRSCVLFAHNQIPCSNSVLPSVVPHVDLQ